jgi:hypothetical protein
MIGSVPDALYVDERDPVMFHTDAGLFDNEPGTTVKNCLT